MKRFWRNVWNDIRSYPKNRAHAIGLPLIVIGMSFLAFQAVLVIFLRLRTEEGLTSISLGLISVGIALHVIGMTRESDKRYTEILKRLDRNVEQLPAMFNRDVLTSQGQSIAEKTVEKESKESAQRRLDEDTQRVGYVRGKLFQNKDGSWCIHWAL